MYSIMVYLCPYKTEVAWKRGLWKSLDDVEYGTLKWLDWLNIRRLLAPIGNVQPAEYEQIYYDENKRSCKSGMAPTNGSQEIPGVVHSEYLNDVGNQKM